MNADFIVKAPSRSYPVTVTDGLPGKLLNRFLDQVEADRVFLIMDEEVRRIYGDRLIESLGERIHPDRCKTVPSGESSKSVDQWSALTDFLLQGNIRRNTRIVVAGGGVTGDLAGFAAATTMRGLPLIHLPTTLLAMVDSSIGGKTGINHATGKNLIGSFYQPEAIFMHSGFLESLPRKEWINGLSEILKYGAIRDPDIFAICRKLFTDRPPRHDNNDLVDLIRRCAQIKANVVAEDERESGLRMILNFGHTYGHALERQGNYQKISHGEAVFAGMLAAAHHSGQLRPELSYDPLLEFRHLYNIDPSVAGWPVDELVKAMYHDKKRSSDHLKLVLLQDWGDPCVVECKELSQVKTAWAWALDQIR